jgi:DnaJ-class molecular chaperone
MRGEDIDAEITLTLDDVHRGVTRTISLQVNEPCTTCGGSGSKDGKTCPTCRGSGVVRRQKSLEVTILAGVRDGSVIRLAGQGEPGANGAPPGDLFLHVTIEPHPLFEIIDDDDIQVEVPVSPWEAALGATVRVPTLDGQAEVKIPAGTQTGKRLRLRAQGLNKRNGGRGDEYVKVKIVIPSKLTQKEKQLFEKLAAESHFDARDLLPRI